MEFKVVQKEIELQSRGWVPTFHDISTNVMKIVEESGIKNGTCAIVFHHHNRIIHHNRNSQYQTE